MKHMFLLMLVVIGCTSPHYYAVKCETDLVGTAGGDSQNFGCDRLISNISLVKKYMMKEWTKQDGSKLQVIRDEQEWQHYFAGLNVFVSKDTTLENDPWIIQNSDEEVWGYYDQAFNEVEVQIDEYSLMHEFFHRVDTLQFKIDTIDHTGWDTNGHGLLNYIYQGSFEDYVGGNLGDTHRPNYPPSENDRASHPH